jgi:hypothetical protein
MGKTSKSGESGETGKMGKACKTSKIGEMTETGKTGKTGETGESRRVRYYHNKLFVTRLDSTRPMLLKPRDLLVLEAILEVPN